MQPFKGFRDHTSTKLKIESCDTYITTQPVIY